ncbi:hypothetical protein [Nesterenkonia halobia]|uniref:Uncharacterized protein n=1 Tax=Nesterenkonia halobia TaxID=37922 RepID=A0ABP6R7U8_9MICC
MSDPGDTVQNEQWVEQMLESRVVGTVLAGQFPVMGWRGWRRYVDPVRTFSVVAVWVLVLAFVGIVAERSEALLGVQWSWVPAVMKVTEPASMSGSMVVLLELIASVLVIAVLLQAGGSLVAAAARQWMTRRSRRLQTPRLANDPVGLVDIIVVPSLTRRAVIVYQKATDEGVGTVRLGRIEVNRPLGFEDTWDINEGPGRYRVINEQVCGDRWMESDWSVETRDAGVKSLIARLWARRRFQDKPLRRPATATALAEQAESSAARTKERLRRLQRELVEDPQPERRTGRMGDETRR